MRRVIFLLVLALAGCAHRPAQTSTQTGPGDWQLASGQPPNEAVFAALVAACEDRGRAAAFGGLDRCLRDLGLRRTP